MKVKNSDIGFMGMSIGWKPITPLSERSDNAELAGVSLNRSGGTVYGEDFCISVVPGSIKYLSCFDEEHAQRTAENIALPDGEWERIEAAVRELTLKEDIPPKPTLAEKLHEKLHGNLEMLDGCSKITLYLTWQSGEGSWEVKYLWGHDDSYSRLWDMLFSLAQNSVK